MNRKNFIKSIIGLSVAPSILLGKSINIPSSHDDDFGAWYHLSNPKEGTIFGYHEVKFPQELMEDVYRQMHFSYITNPNIVYFNPTEAEHSLFRSLGGDPPVGWKETEKYTPDENRRRRIQSHVIGRISGVRWKEGIEAKIEVDDKFKQLPFWKYELRLGLDEMQRIFKEPIPKWEDKKPFTMKSCKFRGLYYHAQDVFTDLRSYYGLRDLGMFMYLPGRAYY